MYSTLANSDNPFEYLESGSGNKSTSNTVNVGAIGCPLIVDGGNSKQSVFIGSHGSSLDGTLSTIQSSVDLENSGKGSTTAYLDDSGDSTKQTFALYSTEVSSTAMPGNVNWLGSGMAGLYVYGGAGDNTWNVDGTGTGFSTQIDTGTAGSGPK